MGRDAERTVETARATLAGLLQCLPAEIIFTGGGTEANNLAILGYAAANKRVGVRIACEPWLHPSVVEPSAQVHNPSGEAALQIYSHTCHETGGLQSPQIEGDKNTIFIDGAQGFTKEPLPAHYDMYSISAHKFHGPSGVGALVVRGGTRILPIMFGGGQERGLRAGSLNVQGICEMVQAAATAHENMVANRAHVQEIRDTIASLSHELANVTVNTTSENTSPYILNMSFVGIRGEIMVHQLSERGIYASTGAACRSRGKNVPALQLMGFAPDIADSAVRFSFSAQNTADEARAARQVIRESVEKLRRILR
jgi:cysteine desulfurase